MDSELLAVANIKEVYYRETYQDRKGIATRHLPRLQATIANF